MVWVLDSVENVAVDVCCGKNQGITDGGGSQGMVETRVLIGSEHAGQVGARKELTRNTVEQTRVGRGWKVNGEILRGGTSATWMTERNVELLGVHLAPLSVPCRGPHPLRCLLRWLEEQREHAIWPWKLTRLAAAEA